LRTGIQNDPGLVEAEDQRIRRLKSAKEERKGNSNKLYLPTQKLMKALIKQADAFVEQMRQKTGEDVPSVIEEEEQPEKPETPPEKERKKKRKKKKDDSPVFELKEEPKDPEEPPVEPFFLAEHPFNRGVLDFDDFNYQLVEQISKQMREIKQSEFKIKKGLP